MTKKASPSNRESPKQSISSATWGVWSPLWLWHKLNLVVDSRLAKANSTYTNVLRTTWRKTKISIYEAVIRTTFLYGAKSWVIYCCHMCLLEHSHQHYLHVINRTHTCFSFFLWGSMWEGVICKLPHKSTHAHIMLRLPLPLVNHSKPPFLPRRKH